MYDNYESRAKLGSKAFLLRLLLALVFLATLGCAGGVLYLLGRTPVARTMPLSARPRDFSPRARRGTMDSRNLSRILTTPAAEKGRR